MKATTYLSEKATKIVIKFQDKEGEDIIPTEALVNFEFDKDGRIVSIEIYINEKDYELKKALIDAFEKRAIKIPIAIR